MAEKFNITADDHFFIGEDKHIEFVMQADIGGTVPNVASWTLEWSLRKSQTASGLAMLVKSSTLGNVIVAGVYNSDPALNQQKITVVFVDTDTALMRGNVMYAHSLKRMDDGNEVVLAYGDFYLSQVTER